MSVLGEKITHESFASIYAGRVSGHTSLFDSAIKHQHYVEITISTAAQYLRDGETRFSAQDELITVAMSESQFAQFITSMNVGSGSPCTLTRNMGKDIAPPPQDINTRQTFEKAIQEKADAMQGELSAALVALNELVDRNKPPTKGEMKAILARVETAKRELVSNMPYMMETFAESMETMMDRVKMDINAHAVMMGQRLAVRNENGTEVLSIEKDE